MEATAGATSVSTGAGTGSAQSGSSSSQATASNSAGQNSPTQRQSSDAAPPSSQQSAQTSEPKPAPKQKQEAAPADDDPEVDWVDGKKYKRSQIAQYIERAQKSQAAEAKRAAEYQKQLAALEKLGVDPQKFAQDPQAAFQEAYYKRIQREIEESRMDPRELELNRREETIKERETRLEAEAKEREQQETTQRVQAKADEYASTIFQALEASNLPKDSTTVARMASLMLAAGRTGSRIPQEKLAALVQQQIAGERQGHIAALRENPKQFVSEMKQYLSGVQLDGKQLADMLGAESVEVLRKHILQEAESKFINPQQPSAPKRPANAVRIPDVTTRQHKKYHTLTQWNEWQEQKGARR